MRKAAAAVCILLLTVPLSSCYDAKEMDDWAYVYTLGFDVGVSDKLRVTVQIPTMKQTSGGGGGGGGQNSSSGASGGKQSGQSNFTVISIDCATLYSGINYINTSLSRTVNLMHVKYILVSEQLAHDNIGQLMDSMARSRQIRRIAHVIIVGGQASKFIQNFNPVVGTAISKTQEGEISQVKLSGLSDDSTLGEFIDQAKSNKTQPHAILASLNDFSGFRESGSSSGSGSASGSSSGSSSSSSSSGGSPSPASSSGSSESSGASGKNSPSGGLASGNAGTFENYAAGQVPRSGGNETEYLGTAVFNGGRFAGILDGDESRVLMMIEGKYERSSFAVADPFSPGYTDTIQLAQKKKPKIKILLNRGKPIIDQTIYLDGEIQALQTQISADDGKLIPHLETQLKQKLSEEFEKTVDHCKALNSDVFGYGTVACRQFLTSQEWNSYKWLSRFRDATVRTRIEIQIKRDGTEIRNNPVQEAEGGSK